MYAGGEFTSIGGQPRNRIAALDPASGSATGWNPNANGVVSALAPNGPTLLAGGGFTNVGGQPRSCIAAINVANGAATSWNPGADNGVLALAVHGNTVYTGGYFMNIGGQTRLRIAALDAVTGAATAWNPSASGVDLIPVVDALALGVGTVYAGGSFGFIGGQGRANIAALDMVTGNATSWAPNASSSVLSLAVGGTTVYAGGSFRQIGGQSRNGIAELLVSTGAATDWDARASLGAMALDLTAGTVYVGGFFNAICDRPQNGVAAISADRLVSVGPPLLYPDRILLAPNPTWSGTRIEYAVSQPGRVRLDLLDVEGRVVMVLADQTRPTGRYTLEWDGHAGQQRLAPGLYYVRVRSAGRTVASRLAILR
jgi:hypothetical protein